MKEENRPWGYLAAAVMRVMVLLLLLALALSPVTARASELPDTVIPVGRAVGIKMFSDGVVVVGTSEVTTEDGTADPAKACGLKEGDIITHINSTEVDSIEEVSALLQELEGAPMSIRAVRGDDQVQLTAQAVFCPDDQTYKLGAWIRDSMAGIGTVTYYDPDTQTFGALGHGINDVDTALLMPLETGSILPASVTGVKKGESGTPGQLKGSFDVQTMLGDLQANTTGGVFGTLTDDSWVSGTPVAVAGRDEVHTGKATILTNISGDEVTEYEIEITRIFKESEDDCRDYTITVTDQRLLDATGGIVQGMSGSPILQDGKFVGAVTHVLVNDPTCGYAISAQRMLTTASQADLT
jgi:stage IV sporulation protein B